MDWKLEVVTVPSADVDRAKAFYEGCGFAVDHDTRVSDTMRFVQITPPGSGCSIVLTPAESVTPLTGLQLVVDDIDAAREQLVAAGVDVTPVQHLDQATGQWVDGRGGRWNSFLHFTDLDGHPWVVQERDV